MILAVAPREIQRSQERVARLSSQVLTQLDDAQRRLRAEDCRGARASIAKAYLLMTDLGAARRRAGLSETGPFHARVAELFNVVGAQAFENCGR